MLRHRIHVIVATCIVLALGVLGGTAREAAGKASTATNAALQWDDAAATTVVKSGAFQNEGLIYMAYVSSAVDNAAQQAVRDHASVDAAVIEAAYRTLNHYFPLPRRSGSPDLETLYGTSLAGVPNGPAKADGQAIGTAAANNLFIARDGDGRVTTIGSTSSFPTLTSGPGVWRLTPNAYAVPQTPWVADVRPFVLRRSDQFQPEGPPSLSSPQWVRAFDEIKADGTGTDPAKKAVALFWTANVILQYNQLLRDVATGRGLSTADSAHAMALVNVIGADAQIACMNAKYHFLFWRPVSAIDPTSVRTTDGFGAAAYDDGNPSTIEQAGWRPLIQTPNHPEYPAAHGSMTGAMSQVFTAITGTSKFDLTIPGLDPATNSMTASRTFATADDLRNDIVNARVWAGVHYRFSGEAGVKLGEKVARYDLSHFAKSDDKNED
jgi:NAD(P)-dependent dehydrogenase (short-subunit alcohol dehydrogenase family)